MTTKRSFLLVIIIVFSGCKLSTEKQLKSLRNPNYTIHVSLLPQSADEDDLQQYKVRVIPGRNIFEAVTAENKQRLWYGTDSCFYLAGKKGDQYPYLVQPIANGIKNSYEYLLVFGNSDNRKDDDQLKLVFNDRIVSKQKYFVELF